MSGEATPSVMGRRTTAALRGTDVTSAIVLVMAGSWGGGAVPGPGLPLHCFGPAPRGRVAAPLRNHGPARPLPLGPTYTSLEGTGSVKSAGRSITPLGGTNFSTAEGKGVGGVQLLEKAVTFVGKNDFIAVSIVTSFVLERPRSCCEQ